MTTTEVADASFQRKPVRTTESWIAAGFRDLVLGLGQAELWIYLGWRDVKKHYKRSVIGPFWLTLSMGIMVGSLGFLYSQIFKMEVSQYLPFLAIGFIVWGLISGSITAACTVFSSNSGSIQQIRLPHSIYVMQFVCSQFISFLHNFVIYLFVIAIFGINPGWQALLFIPALFLLLLNAAFFAMILGPFCARFRDIPMIVSSIVQVSFFLTPIIWSVKQIPDRAFFVNANPFYHFIEIARDPLLGSTGTLTNWIACVGITIAMGIVSFTFFSRYRSRISYWA